MNPPTFWQSSLWFLVLIIVFGLLRIAMMIYQPYPGRQAPQPASHDVHDAILTTQQAYEWEKKQYQEREKQGTEAP